MRNLQILKKMLKENAEKSSRITWIFALNIAEVDKLGKLAVVVYTAEAIRFEFWMKGASVTIGGNLCFLCLVILKSV